ncbi:MAG: hypothetical protein ABR962_00845 [Candidatus Bathyarchaeia archaeon]
MNKTTERIIDKYTLIPIVAMLMAVIYLVVGLSEVNIGIFAGDIGLLVTAVLFAQEIRKAMKNRASKELLRHESPIDWLKASTKYFVFSLLSSLAYGFVNVQNVGVENNPVIEYLLIFSVGFFLFGLLYTVRIIWFIIDPASKANILAGRVLKTTRAIGIRLVYVSFILFLQVFNGIMLYLILSLIFVTHTALTTFAIVYLPTLILSFIAAIPYLHLIIFRLNEKARIRDWIATFCFYIPWIVLVTYSLLLRAGIIHL